MARAQGSSMPAKPIKAVVFDSDGTLLDSFDVIVGAYAHVAQTLGYPAPTREEVQAQLAQAYPLYQILATFFPGANVEEMMRLNGEYIAGHANDSSKFEGLEALLASLHGQGIKIAILTGGDGKVEDLYKQHGLDHYFDSFVHCDRVVCSKPDPEGFLLAAEECDVTPAEMVMVGDSPTDIFAGKNAGAAVTIGITHGHGTTANLLASDPDYVVHSLDELGVLLQKLIDSAS